ncbi:MAG: MarR family winged helix-turn-helix transcriptional regulator [Actinomycetota bacterium]
MTPASRAAVIDEAEIAARLRLSATRLARRLRQEADSGFTPSQLSALATIHNSGPITLGALADQERVAPPSITKVVAKLEAEGLVERTPDAIDGRVCHVSTTRAGRALVEESRRRKTTWLAGRLHELGPDAQARLAAALDVLEDILADEDRP